MPVAGLRLTVAPPVLVVGALKTRVRPSGSVNAAAPVIAPLPGSGVPLDTTPGTGIPAM